MVRSKVILRQGPCRDGAGNFARNFLQLTCLAVLAMHDNWLVAAYTAVCVIITLMVYFYRQYWKPKQDKKLSELIAFKNVNFRTRIFYPFVNPKGVMNLRPLSAEMDAGMPWLDVSKITDV